MRVHGIGVGRTPGAGRPVLTRLTVVQRAHRRRDRGFGDDGWVSGATVFVFEGLPTATAGVRAVLGNVAIDRTCAFCGDRRHGKPRIAGGPAFSASARDGLAVVAVADAEVGVDVERWSGPDGLEGAALALAPGERAAASDPVAFLALWTRKEAYLKGIGRGLAEDPARVTFGGEDEAGWAPVVHDGVWTEWVVRTLPGLPAGVVGALAVRGGPRPVRVSRRAPAPAPAPPPPPR
jgi:4'-phosphopantetheinyl transferase